MSRFLVWEQDSDEAAATVIENAYDVEDAASDAVERWHDEGRYAGDPVPDEIAVFVRCCEYQSKHSVKVAPEYDVSFRAHSAVEV